MCTRRCTLLACGRVSGSNPPIRPSHRPPFNHVYTTPFDRRTHGGGPGRKNAHHRLSRLICVVCSCTGPAVSSFYYYSCARSPRPRGDVSPSYIPRERYIGARNNLDRRLTGEAKLSLTDGHKHAVVVGGKTECSKSKNTNQTEKKYAFYPPRAPRNATRNVGQTTAGSSFKLKVLPFRVQKTHGCDSHTLYPRGLASSPVCTYVFVIKIGSLTINNADGTIHRLFPFLILLCSRRSNNNLYIFKRTMLAFSEIDSCVALGFRVEKIHNYSWYMPQSFSYI